MNDKDVIVISLGGSVVLSEDIDHTFFQEFTQFIMDLSQTFKIFLIIGGGKTARNYINLGRAQGFSESNLDWLGIHTTRLNAMFLSMVLTSEIQSIPETIDKALSRNDHLVIMGGTTPGHSTDYVGACLASQTHATMYIIATNVDGIYNKDPNKHPNAIHLPEVSIDTLLNQYGNSWDAAGKNTVIDGPALQHIKDHQIPTFVVDGRSIKEIKNITNKKPFRGTKIIK